MSSHKLRKILLIILALFVVGLVVLFFVKDDGVIIPLGVSNNSEKVNLKIPSAKNSVEQNIETGVKKTKADSVENSLPVKVDLPAISPEVRARLFVEKMGSWSNNNIDAHVADIEGLVTTDYFDSIRSAFYSVAKKYPVSDGFYGVTTRVYNVKTQSLQESLGVARVVVMIQREMEYMQKDKDMERTNETKEIYVELRKKGNLWLVSDTNWW